MVSHAVSSDIPVLGECERAKWVRVEGMMTRRGLRVGKYV